MSGAAGAGAEDIEATAAEYVLGVLDLAEMRGVRVRARSDAALAAAIVDWEIRLAPLAAAVVPEAPPTALWTRIEQRIAAIPEEEEALPPEPPPPANDPVAPSPFAAPTVVPLPSRGPRRAVLRAWQAATVATLALAAVLAGIAFLPGLQRGGEQLATIAPIGAPQPAFIASVQPNGTATLVAMAPAEVPPDRDLELWVLPPGAHAVAPLGILPVTGRSLHLSAVPPTGTQLLISLEPRGGSPTGQPTGPVLYAGTLSST